jgi:hypothetical protein
LLKLEIDDNIEIEDDIINMYMNNNINVINEKKDDHYEVLYIIKHRKNLDDNSTDYYVKWKKYDIKYSS